MIITIKLKWNVVDDDLKFFEHIETKSFSNCKNLNANDDYIMFDEIKKDTLLNRMFDMDNVISFKVER